MANVCSCLSTTLGTSKLLLRFSLDLRRGRLLFLLWRMRIKNSYFNMHAKF